jgi:hypothetical protein
MVWIKRNLYFLIGTVVALALMGGAGWYLYSRLDVNNDILGKLDEQYSKLSELAKQTPHPGTGKGKSVDNIKIAEEQKGQLLAFRDKTRGFFQPIAHIPNSPKVTDQDFVTAFRRTIEQLQHQATNASVTLPPAENGYSFSFTAEKGLLKFAPSGLEPLSAQLGEVKTICDVLFAAKVNALDGLRRERVSPDDSSSSAQQTDYLDLTTSSNELATISPYEISFRCFSPELAAVLSGFAASQHALIVKTVNVGLAPAMAAEPAPAPVTMVPQPQPIPVTPYGGGLKGGESDAFMSRYGLGPGGRGGRFGGPPPPQPVAPAPIAVAPVASKGGLQTVLDEKQLQVKLTLAVVKLASK